MERLTREDILNWFEFYCKFDTDPIFNFVDNNIDINTQKEYIIKITKETHSQLLDILENQGFRRDFFKQFDSTILIEFLICLSETGKCEGLNKFSYHGKDGGIFMDFIKNLKEDDLMEIFINMCKEELNEDFEENLIKVMNKIDNKLLEKYRTKRRKL